MKGIILVLAMLVFAGCNTVKGLGTDIEKAGAALKRSVEK